MATPWLSPLQLTLFFLLTVTYSSSSPSRPPSESDILLSFKSSLDDPSNALSTWSAATAPTSLCSSWVGITCTSGLPTGAARVTAISLQSFNLSGDIPSTLCHLPSLAHLNLAANNFSSPIPLGLSQCTSLQTLNLSANLLWGPIPDQLSSLAALQVLDLSDNRLEGMIPEGLGSLSALQLLNLRGNLLTGGINANSGLANLTALVHLDLSGNLFLESELPVEIAGLRNLRRVLMRGSGFYGPIPDAYRGLLSLEVLDLSQNNLTGSVPVGFGLGMPELASVDLSENKLSGPFPADVCSGNQKLVRLHLYSNSLTGPIPASFAAGRCLGLEDFQVQNNALSGPFPTGLWSLPKIAIIRAENNRLTGELPGGSTLPSSRLEQVQIDNNDFTGTIPAWIGSARAMYMFSASLNRFSGGLPDGFCGSDAMSIMNLSRNALSGPIPELKNCKKLVSLALAGNTFTGIIPTSISHLPVLTYIDLSDNKLTGEIPPGIEYMKLALFNVSFNQLTGRVAPVLVSGLPASYLQGNPGLCGPGLPGVCNSDQKAANAKATAARSYRVVRVLLCALVAVALTAAAVGVAAGLFARYRRTTHRELHCRDSSDAISSGAFFYPLNFTAEDLLSLLNDKNVVGRGALGKTYVVQLSGKPATTKSVAVKELALPGDILIRNLKDEITILAKSRHKNITHILGFFICSDESVYLVYEWLPNGSLADAMRRPSGAGFGWKTRLRIAIGVARGLCYLHKDHAAHLLHRNVKSSNVLLDDDFEPKLTDFALDRVVGEPLFLSSVASESSSSCYIAPEQAYVKKPTEAMDVYGFGVVLLELLTGRPASQHEHKDDSLDVVRWVRRKINTAEGAARILDPRLTGSPMIRAEMLDALDLAVRCSSVMPEKRPEMPEVVRLLQSLEAQGNSTRNIPHVEPSTCSAGRDADV